MSGKEESATLRRSERQRGGERGLTEVEKDDAELLHALLAGLCASTGRMRGRPAAHLGGDVLAEAVLDLGVAQPVATAMLRSA